MFNLGKYDFTIIFLQAVTKFESLLNQVKKNARDIDDRLHKIENVRLFKQPPPQQGVSCMEAKVM